jgi:hypothetical protein
MAAKENRNSCLNFFKRSDILCLPSEYACSLIKFFENNPKNIQTNSALNRTC